MTTKRSKKVKTKKAPTKAKPKKTPPKSPIDKVWVKWLNTP